MKLISWNVNGIRAIAKKDFSTSVKALNPDILCLQECKSPVEKIPTDAFAALGYTHMISRGQKGYNGVAILSRTEARVRHVGLPGQDEFGARVLAAEVDDLVQRQRESMVKDELDRIYTKNGGEFMNAGTTEDLTLYFIRVPSNRLELWAWLESDRLLNLVFREFYSERDVVFEPDLEIHRGQVVAPLRGEAHEGDERLRAIFGRAGAILGVGVSTLGLAACQRSTPPPPFRISLAEWSLHRAILREKSLDHLDFARIARERFDLDAIEYVNQMFFDRAEDAADELQFAAMKSVI